MSNHSKQSPYVYFPGNFINYFLRSLNILRGKIIVIPLVLLFTLQHLNALILIDQNSTSDAPKMVIQSLTVNAGTVKPGDIVKVDFQINNRGNADLIIKRVAPT